MASASAFSDLLNNDSEPLDKRIKIVHNVFNNSEYTIPHKEAIFLKWILSNTNLQNDQIWDYALNLLSSNKFQDLSQREISNEDVSDILKAVSNKLKTDVTTQETSYIIKLILYLNSNKIFQQFYQYNVKTYSKLIGLCLEKIDASIEYLNFIKNPNIFLRNILLNEKFNKPFLNNIYPSLVNGVARFISDNQIYKETVSITRKVLFGNIKLYQNFLNRISNVESTEIGNVDQPMLVFNYLISTLSKDFRALNFRIIFSAFCENSVKESDAIIKCTALILDFINFNISEDFNLKHSFESVKIPLHFSLEIILELLKVLSNFSISDLGLLKLLRKLLKSLLNLKSANPLILNIIVESIHVNPLIIEPIITDLIVSLVNFNSYDLYEPTIFEVINVFAKLHRFEHFIAKLIPALNLALCGEKSLVETEQIFQFTGTLEPKFELNLNHLLATNILTERILNNLTNCLLNLVSWQIINIFKTLLFHMRNAIQEFSDGKYDTNGYLYMELIGILIMNLLQSVKIADHTVPQNVVNKFVVSLEELKVILKDFGGEILKREHAHITMRNFLGIAFIWAEVYISLTYYSMDKEVEIVTVKDRHGSHLTYLHSYLDDKQWKLIIQRITNFGIEPCKKLLHKLYTQKLKTMLLFGDSDEQLINKIVKSLIIHLDVTWTDFVTDTFILNNILNYLDEKSLTYLAECLVENNDLIKKCNIKSSLKIVNITVYITIFKISKLFRTKRKRDDEELIQPLCLKIFNLYEKELFLQINSGELVAESIFDQIKLLFKNPQFCDIKFKEQKFDQYLNILESLPLVYCEPFIQKLILIFLIALSMDTLNCCEKIKNRIENLIIGMLQECRYSLNELFATEVFAKFIIQKFQKYTAIFSLLVDNILKHESKVNNLNLLVEIVVENLNDTRFLNCSFLLLQTINKVKKSKCIPESKENFGQSKILIISKICELILNSEDFKVEAYAICLKHYLTAEDTDQGNFLTNLIKKLDDYVNYCINSINDIEKKGCAMLFTLVLQHRTKINIFHEDIIIKIWNSWKSVNMNNEYSHLINLIIGQIPDNEFQIVTSDLKDMTDKSIEEKNYSQLCQKLSLWESIISCSVNPEKMRLIQENLEEIYRKIFNILKETDSNNEELIKSFVHLMQNVIKEQHFILSASLIDMTLMINPILIHNNKKEHFEANFSLSVSILEALLKYRNPLIMDRLPAYLQQFRALFQIVTLRSNSDNISEQIDQKLATNSAHRLEKLIKNLINCKKDMARIAAFLIADIFETYEKINLFPNVKLHLNNCIYSLISLCDIHAVNYLMRSLSDASTEMFKIMHEHYKKYYMFTGKV